MIYRARKIITMNPARPSVTHVCVRDGRIVGAGSIEELSGCGEHQVDDGFADKILMPGFVEGHCHVMEGVFWRFVYCGYFDRRDPDGRVWPGAKSMDEVIARLSEAQTGLAAGQPLTGWSLDPIYFDDGHIDRSHLDRVSTTRPIGVMSASCHVLSVNTRALELADLLRPGISHPGIPLAADGLPTGEMRGDGAMSLVALHTGFSHDIFAVDADGLRQFSRQCVQSGVTTATDLASMLSQDTLDMMLRVTAEESFPARIVALRMLFDISAAAIIERVLALGKSSTDRLRLGMIKIIVDGSIQGFTARLKWPGYHNGAANGLWYVPPEQLREIYPLALKNGVQIHTHTNGDQATELVLDCVEAALRQYPAADHRFTIQHCQLADAAQFRRIRALGMCVNLFANHLYYWGDQHYAISVGPERAERMNACATALANGVPMAIHSDAPVTPLGPLFTAWCAVNRKTVRGRTLGEYECLSVHEALHAITLGAAYTLRLDGEVGSIECGKRADFAVLEDDPTEVGGDRLRDVRVWGTVQGGRVFAAKDI